MGGGRHTTPPELALPEATVIHFKVEPYARVSISLRMDSPHMGHVASVDFECLGGRETARKLAELALALDPSVFAEDDPLLWD